MNELTKKTDELLEQIIYCDFRTEAGNKMNTVKLISVKEALETDPNIDKATADSLLRAIVLQAEADKPEPKPREKKEFVVVLSDPAGIIPKGQDFVCWVTQIPEVDAISETLDKIHRAAYEHNISKRGRKYPVDTVGEACEAVSARFLKEQGVAIKTKFPVSVIITDNKIPKMEEGG